MPYDSEIPAAPRPKHNMELLIERLETIPADDYSWANTSKCVIGHAAQLMGGNWWAVGSGTIYAWMGVSPADGERLFIGPGSVSRLRTRKKAVRHLRAMIRAGRVAGLAPAKRPGVFARLFAALPSA